MKRGQFEPTLIEFLIAAAALVIVILTIMAMNGSLHGISSFFGSKVSG